MSNYFLDVTDLPTLYDVNLPGLTAAELHGPWNIAVLRPARAGEPFWTEATHLRLHESTFFIQAATGLAQQGTWHLQRHHSLGQPFLVFHFFENVAQALITRLRRSATGELRQMVVYFQSGLELQLTHP